MVRLGVGLVVVDFGSDVCWLVFCVVSCLVIIC